MMNKETNKYDITDEEAIDEILSGEVDEAVDELINESPHFIKYGLKFGYPNNWHPFTITHNEVDTYDFTKNFNEFLINEERVHLYFDFDSITNEDEFIEVYAWLDKVKKVFGNYSIGGYCNNEEMEGYGFRMIPGDKHYLSVHVVFYESSITCDDLMEIMKHSDAKGYFKHEVNKFCDPNVYKLKSRQVFRHVLSDKCFKEGHESNRANHGYILNHLMPSTQIVQIRGSEPVIARDQWIEVFPDVVSKTEQARVEKVLRKQERADRNLKIEGLEFDDNLIVFDDEAMDQFLSHFNPEFDNLLQTLAPLRYSPYGKGFLREHLTKWYGQREHTNGTENVVEQILSYHKRENTNKWFYSLLKHLPEDVAQEYKERYNAIDVTVDINTSTWTIEDIRRKSYDIKGFGKLLSDLRGVVGFVEDIWYLRTKKEGQVYIKEMNDEKLAKKLKGYKPFRGNDHINLAQIVMKYSRYFAYDSAEISKDNKEDVINIFQGFKYTEIFSDDFTLLSQFLDHIRHIICADSDEKYEYFMKWWACIFQNITVKNGTMPIIHGAQGSGKSFPIEVFCELLGCFALANVDDLDKVFGKFNGLIGRHLVININEPPEATEKFKYLGKIKSKLTQKRTVQETKGIDQIEINSWANYMMTTNNPNPVQEEKGDRRIIYFATNNEKCGDKKYFDELCKPIQAQKQGEYSPEFMGLLLHYMKTQIDTEGFDAEELIRAINSRVTENRNEQLERQLQDLNSVDRFIVDNYKLFEYGIALEDIKIEGYTQNGVARKLGAVCDQKRMTAKQYQRIIDLHPEIYGSRTCNDARVRVYTLKAREQIPDLYAIIDYKRHGDELMEAQEQKELEDEQMPEIKPVNPNIEAGMYELPVKIKASEQ